MLLNVSVNDYRGKSISFGYSSQYLIDIPTNNRYKDLLVAVNAGIRDSKVKRLGEEQKTMEFKFFTIKEIKRKAE